MLTRRHVVASLGAGLGTALAAPALAQHAGHEPSYSHLSDPSVKMPPADAMQLQQVFDSPAPKAENQGRWTARAPLPLPRSEMAWATVLDGKMHMIGGYGEQRVDRPYHQVYDPAIDKWSEAAQLPRGANHIGVAVVGGRLYAIGGFLEQNRKPDNLCFVLDADTWRPIAPLPKAAGAIACVGLGGELHAIGGAVGDTFDAKKSVDWHLVYDPRIDQWSTRAPLPTGRDHTGTLTANGLIHVIGGRVDSFYTNSNLHHAYDPNADKWKMRAPLPTARSGHGAVLYRDKIFVMGGEGINRVFGQNEAYDPATDSWRSYAPMPTPRHGLGAVAIGDFIYVAGGGPMNGGTFQSALNEAFTLD
jgi:N-acetylneuraminic acid mutarotase